MPLQIPNFWPQWSLPIPLPIMSLFLFLTITIPSLCLSSFLPNSQLPHFQILISSILGPLGEILHCPSIPPMEFSQYHPFFFPIAWAGASLFLLKTSLFTCALCCFFLKLAPSYVFSQYLICNFFPLSSYLQYVSRFKHVLTPKTQLVLSVTSNKALPKLLSPFFSSQQTFHKSHLLWIFISLPLLSWH